MQHNSPPPQAARLRRPLERALLRDPSMIPDSPLPRLTFLILQVIQCVCGFAVFVSDSICVPGAIISTSLIALQAKYLSGLESKEWASPSADS